MRNIFKMIFGGKIESFEKVTLCVSGMRYVSEYEITPSGDKAVFSEYCFTYRDGKRTRELKNSAFCDLAAATELLNKCRLITWDGFDGKRPPGVLDGIDFSLKANVDGNKTICANGSQNFPRHYRDLVDGIHKVLSSESPDADK